MKCLGFGDLYSQRRDTMSKPLLKKFKRKSPLLILTNRFENLIILLLEMAQKLKY